MQPAASVNPQPNIICTIESVFEGVTLRVSCASSAREQHVPGFPLVSSRRYGHYRLLGDGIHSLRRKLETYLQQLLCNVRMLALQVFTILSI